MESFDGGEPIQQTFGGHMIRATVGRSTTEVGTEWMKSERDLRDSVRKFETGATRDTDAGKIDFEGFLSPLTLRAYGEYMHRHRHLPDGSLRASDNWQLGLSQEVYMKSLWRHFFAVWEENRGIATPDGLVENLCAVLFNASGMLHEVLKARADHTPSAGYAMPLADRED